MILQALYDYYQRKAADPESGIAPEGWEWREIYFLVVIDQDGNFIRFKDTREGEGNQRRAKKFLVPTLGEKKGSGIKSNILWETLEYVFGVSTKPGQKSSRIKEQHLAFKEKIMKLTGDTKPLNALKAFVNKNHDEQITRDPIWDKVLELNRNLLLSLDGEGPFSDLKHIQEAINATRKGTGIFGPCLVSGKDSELSRLEPSIRGIKGANPTGASLVAVNNKVLNGNNGGQTPAFASFMKQQGFNSPISASASFAYTTALNMLLEQDSLNKINIGDMTIVFWAQKKSENFDLETELPWFFKSDKDDPDKNVNAVRSLYQAIEAGRLPLDEDDRFYVLGLAPNDARISVRFWKTGKMADFALCIRQHFKDFNIVHRPNDHEYLSLYQILTATVLDYKMDNVPPNLAGAVVVSILDGTPYPRTLVQQCIRRIRAEQKEEKVTRTRAAILKASINRRYNNSAKEVLVALDRTNTDPGYRMGRLFAVMGKIQEESSPGINATIRDRFYGAASSTPVTVFPCLLRLMRHHLAKLALGRKIQMEKEVQDIMDALKAKAFPAHLTLDQQSMFAIGYYHQRQDFFKKKDVE